MEPQEFDSSPSFHPVSVPFCLSVQCFGALEVGSQKSRSWQGEVLPEDSGETGSTPFSLGLTGSYTWNSELFLHHHTGFSLCVCLWVCLHVSYPDTSHICPVRAHPTPFWLHFNLNTCAKTLLTIKITFTGSRVRTHTYILRGVGVGDTIQPTTPIKMGDEEGGCDWEGLGVVTAGASGVLTPHV